MSPSPAFCVCSYHGRMMADLQGQGHRWQSRSRSHRGAMQHNLPIHIKYYNSWLPVSIQLEIINVCYASLTHWGLVTDGDIDLGLHWLRIYYQWLGAIVHVMACCLTAPSHYLNQCWLITSEVLWHSSEGNSIRNAQHIYPWYEFENN